VQRISEKGGEAWVDARELRQTVEMRDDRLRKKNKNSATEPAEIGGNGGERGGKKNSRDFFQKGECVRNWYFQPEKTER